MYKPSNFAKAAMAAAAGVVALSAAVTAPSAAAAQPYPDAGPPPPPAADCHDDKTNRGVAGALIGGALGAVFGSQVAAHGHRTDGSLLGGGVGAVTGAMVGRSSANCPPAEAPPPPPPRVAYAPPPPPYAYGPPPPPPPPYVHEQRWVYGYHGERYRITDRPIDPDGCTVAEGRLYLPDGRVEPNFVRVCLNPAGRFQIVG